MGLIDFQIVFEKPLPTYFPGERVNGQLSINLNSEKSMQCIKVRFRASLLVDHSVHLVVTVPLVRAVHAVVESVTDVPLVDADTVRHALDLPVLALHCTVEI